MKTDRPISRPLVLVFALVFLFETWVWDKAVLALSWVARRIPWQRIRRSSKDLINRLPAVFAVLLFGVPVVAMELGSAVAVVFAALGHVVLGACMYAFMKLFGVTLIAVIYDLTQEKLLTLAWFVWLHGKYERLHEFARELVKPYREAVKAQIARLKQRASTILSSWGIDFHRARREARPRKSEAFASRSEYD